MSSIGLFFGTISSETRVAWGSNLTVLSCTASLRRKAWRGEDAGGLSQMDIDVQGTAAYDFSSTFPLPFRVQFLTFATIAGFATNLHLLAFLGIDTSLVLDVRLEDYRPSQRSNLQQTSSLPAPYVHPSRLYPPIYSLAFLGLAWTTFGWLVFSKITGGIPEEMVRWRAIPALSAIVCFVAAVVPFNILFRKERMMLLRCLKRIINFNFFRLVPFCDIILADILTSSAKVLGDVWVSGCLLFTVTKKFGLGEDDAATSGCARVLMVPIMTSLPYLFRLRQCLSEICMNSTPTPRRSMWNALKYTSALPVIFFSAMQTIIGDPFDEVEREAAKTAWVGRRTLFDLWVLAVLVNSLFSFWWDVTNDWGLSLLTRNGWSSNQNAYAFIHPPNPSSTSNTPASGMGRRGSYPPPTHTAHARVRSTAEHLRPGNSLAPGETASTQYPPPPSRPHSPSANGLSASPSKTYHGPSLSVAPTPTSSTSTSPAAPPTHRSSHNRAYSTAATPNLTFPFLRPILLLPDPTIYYLAIAIDLILRFTWSLKLSSHLHSIHEIEAGIFVMEALEVVRRWMWVFLRIEWEAVRKGGGGLSLDAREAESRLRAAAEDEENKRGIRDEPYRDIDVDHEEEIGLGILVENSRH
ncbi:EXS-domain-containing protein [Meredithblackwellia eburnea MCA 4105]